MSGLARPRAALPVTVLTGFLGAGKTTVLRHVLADPALTRTAVIVNEFGPVGLDHHLLETGGDEVVLLGGGCLCCMRVGELAASLMRLLERRERGEIPAFRRVVVETSGLAEPGPLLQTFWSDPLRLSRYHLERVVTCVDAATCRPTFARHREAARQVAMADAVLITKSDLGGARSCRRAVRALNPNAPIADVRHGRVDRAWLTGALPRNREHEGPPGAPIDHSASHHAIGAFDLALATDLEFTRLVDALDGLIREHGEQLLRIKGLAKVAGIDEPVKIDGVQHVFHRPTRLRAWPSGRIAPWLTVLAEGVGRATIESHLARLLAPGKLPADEPAPDMVPDMASDMAPDMAPDSIAEPAPAMATALTDDPARELHEA